jgi:hypothetical protein
MASGYHRISCNFVGLEFYSGLSYTTLVPLTLCDGAALALKMFCIRISIVSVKSAEIPRDGERCTGRVRLLGNGSCVRVKWLEETESR